MPSGSIPNERPSVQMDLHNPVGKHGRKPQPGTFMGCWALFLNLTRSIFFLITRTQEFSSIDLNNQKAETSVKDAGSRLGVVPDDSAD